MGEEVKIAYLCDGLAECSDKPGCFRCMKQTSNCCHTFDPKHAVNGPTDDPEHDPRFTKLDGTDMSGITYWEGDSPITYERWID